MENGLKKGMGIGGWLTNYKRFNVLPDEWRLALTEGDYEHFDSFITRKDVEYIASLGFDHIRLGFDQIVVEESPFVYRERTMRKLDEFVRWCVEAGVRPVLNLHKAVGNYCDIPEKVLLLDDEILQNRFVALWEELERRYSGENLVAFELLNEVRNVDADKWNALCVRTLAAIRRLNRDRLVIVGGTDWNSAHVLYKMKTYDDPNVIYTFHMYEPFEFTHQRGVLQAPTLYYNRALSYPCADVERYRDYHRLVFKNDNTYKDFDVVGIEYLRKAMAGAKRFRDENPDKILWLGEFGTIRHADLESRENYMRDVISICREWGIPYCVWNYLSTPNDGNRFSLVDDNTRKVLSPRLEKIITGR